MEDLGVQYHYSSRSAEKVPYGRSHRVNPLMLLCRKSAFSNALFFVLRRNIGGSLPTNVRVQQLP